MKEIAIYIKERFPLPLVLFLALGYGFFIIGISLTHGAFETTALLIALVTLSFTGFLLRQRITDEFKDNEHDATNYPHRPVQRGLVTKKQLIALGLVALGVELFSIFLIGGAPALAWYIPFFIYSLLMAKEFFMPAWLNRHFTLYFVLHQCIFIFCLIWSFGFLGTPLTMQTVLLATAFILALASIEIIRKFKIRHNSKGVVVADTYPAVWGTRGSMYVLVSLILAMGVLLSIGTSSFIPLAISASSLFGISLSRQNTRAIQVIGSVHFITQAIVVVVL